MDSIKNKRSEVKEFRRQLSDPLVSIIVITYNSSKYVRETLESANAQTYKNLELIISDDCSTDDTLEICQDWLEKNKERFIRTELITVQKNTGIPSNCNRGFNASQGDWIKYIAGDDILLPNCIDSNILFTAKNPESQFIYSKLSHFGAGIINQRIRTESFYFKKFNNCKNKLKFYRRNPTFINTPTWFIKRSALNRLKGFNSKLRIFEDQDLFFRLLVNKIQISYLNETTVKYRLHEESVSRDLKNNSLIRSEKIAIYKKYRRPFLSSLNLVDFIYKYDFFVNVRLSNRYLRLIFRIFNPLFYYRKLIMQL